MARLDGWQMGGKPSSLAVRQPRWTDCQILWRGYAGKTTEQCFGI